MTILPTHKNSISYYEHCKIVMSDTRLCYVKDENSVEKHICIPYANTNVVLLGPGTSLSQAAAKLLCSEGVMVAFVGGGGLPVYYASLNEYRPTDYCQAWISFWNDETERLNVAKLLHQNRADFLKSRFERLNLLTDEISLNITNYKVRVADVLTNNELLGVEGSFAKNLYAHVACKHALKFKRTPQADDLANRFIDIGNYICYGLAASVLWTTGLPPSLSVQHGKTRRGGLVFDLADVIKDSLVLPIAFESVGLQDKENMFRFKLITAIDDEKAVILLYKILEGIKNDYTRNK